MTQDEGNLEGSSMCSSHQNEIARLWAFVEDMRVVYRGTVRRAEDLTYNGPETITSAGAGNRIWQIADGFKEAFDRLEEK